MDHSLLCFDIDLSFFKNAPTNSEGKTTLGKELKLHQKKQKRRNPSRVVTERIMANKC
jgi:hypothetical protein